MIENLAADERRDASDSIRGYLYQAYQSVYAWMNLGPQEELFLEGAEDFDVCSADHAVSTQVKNQERSVTLRARDVVSAIENLWEHRDRNKSRLVHLRFLTTAERGFEQGRPFGDLCGLDYWERAARGEVSLQPIRNFLANELSSQSLLQFLRESNDKILQAELLTKIEWDTGNRPLGALKELIEEDLIIRGDKRHIHSHAAVRVLPVLLKHIADKLASKGEKRLTLAGFIALFDESTLERVPHEEIAALRAMAILTSLASGKGPAHPSGELDVFDDPLPLVPNAALRASLTEKLAGILSRNSALFISGSTGLGKTHLARAVADAVGFNFRWAGFRNLPATVVATRLTSALSSLRGAASPPLVVLDDLDLASSPQYAREFILLVTYIRQRKGSIITTGYGKCPADTLLALWLPSEVEVEAPYLTEEDVGDVLRAHECDATRVSLYSKVILAVTRGHPQLVHARVRRLASESWPPVSAATVLQDTGTESIRDFARRRLQDELPSDARQLAYRLSIAFGLFSRGHALRLGELSPTIPAPGEAFDNLVGPWIERLRADIYRVSPLLSNAGRAALSESQVRAVREALALYPLEREEVTPSEVGEALMQGILAKSVHALARLAVGLLHQDLARVPGLFDALALLPAMATQTGQMLCDTVPSVDVMLRVLQFNVASGNKQIDAALLAVDRAEESIQREESAEQRSASMALAYGTFLAAIAVPLAPSRSLRMLARIFEDAKGGGAVRDLIAEFNMPEGREGNELSFLQGLFQFEVVRARGVEGLDQFLSELDGIDPELRAHLLESLDDTTANLVLNNPWVHDEREERLNPDRTVAVLEHAKELASRWESRPLRRAACIAIAVMHNEYRHEPESALDVLRAAADEFEASEGTIQIAIGKVHFGRQEYQDALAAFSAGLADKGVGHVDRIFASRTMAISAARLGGWPLAERIFLGACDEARQPGSTLTAMAIGLRADAAFARWKQREFKGALELSVDVLDDLDKIPEQSDLLGTYVHATVCHMVAWIWADSQSGPMPSGFVEPPPGMCSYPSPDKSAGKLPMRTLPGLWQLLAHIDERLGTGLHLAAAAKAHSSAAVPVAFQGVARTAAYDGLRHGRGLEIAVKIFIEYMEAAQLRGRLTTEDARKPTEIPKLSATFWEADSSQQYLLAFLIAVAIVSSSLLPGSSLPLVQWRSDLEHGGALTAQVDLVLRLLEGGGSAPESELLPQAAAALSIVSRNESTPRERFNAHFRLLNAVAEGGHVEIAGEAIANLIASSWKDMVERQRFALISPNLHCANILAACQQTSKRGLTKGAAILLAVAPAADAVVQEGGRRWLETLANRQ